MDPIQQALHHAGSRTNVHRSTITCCCGRPECVYLQHNHAALEGLERDVETAAKLGQALLARHESYKAEAEQDRNLLATEIDALERDKREVQAENARIIEENRGLLEQLEGLNEAIAESDAKIKSLTATLESTQLEVRRLAVSASRVAHLEAQIRDMETEQAELHEKLTTAEEDGKSAIQRWRKAECTLRDIHDQLDRIEVEAQEEREKHVELLGRMERRRIVERELDSAAGRLKGAAAVSSLERNKNGSVVVSRFVRDILQDNANLQMGIVELREMLQNSNEEVQNLREQVHLHHQPLSSESDNARQGNIVPLSEELNAKLSGPASPEFHVHHHYHTPAALRPQRREKVQIPLQRRQKKRRGMVSPSPLRSSSRHSPGPSTSHHAHGSISSTSTILSQTSVSIPPNPSSHRWSGHSSNSSFNLSMLSSSPNSPQSGYGPASIFDRMDHDFDSSRPTSPESSGFTSPSIKPSYPRGRYGESFRSVSGPAELLGRSRISSDISQLDPVDGIDHNDTIASPFSQPTILEEREESSSIDTADRETLRPNYSIGDSSTPDPKTNHSIRRSASHESLLSVSGMDIHTLRDRPSQLLIPYSSTSLRTPRRLASAGAIFSSSPPVLSRTNIIVPSSSLSSGRSIDNNLSNLLSSVVAAASTSPGPSSSNPSSRSPSIYQPDDASPSRGAGLGRRVGGWVFGKWGATPARLPDDMHSPTPSQIDPASPPHTPDRLAVSLSSPYSIFLSRPPGVNQKGPIPGFKPPKKPPIAIHAKNIDEELLEETLRE
ncbi:hypothetical protein AJ80_05894 [Polytolypa hystricis UAMH7299]|uniref:Uncharacterized protein n=1 Tax=Polytolypa hystricis (strain UAMH7299) TaxID=1447883 RepID=A0A2B7XS27_POLH7|nr:hypothetical protein AJ80_05894 [Polytolypa hystricis UAMH7299]